MCLRQLTKLSDQVSGGRRILQSEGHLPCLGRQHGDVHAKLGASKLGRGRRLQLDMSLGSLQPRFSVSACYVRPAGTSFQGKLSSSALLHALRGLDKPFLKTTQSQKLSSAQLVSGKTFMVHVHASRAAAIMQSIHCCKASTHRPEKQAKVSK